MDDSDSTRSSRRWSRWPCASASPNTCAEEGPAIVEAFNTEALVHTGDDLPDRDYLTVLAAMPSLDAPARRVAGPSANDGELASAVESSSRLYLTKRLAKDASARGRSIARGTVSARSLRLRRFGDDDDFNDLDVEEMLRMLADDFMENGDLEEAMDRLLREGYTTADGERVEGLRDLLEQARAKRSRARNSQADPDARCSAIATGWYDIEATEDAELDDLLAEAEASDDERRKEVTRGLVDQEEDAA